MRQDLGYAVRQLRNSPGFSVTAILTLALGIGATVAIYCVIHVVLVDPLPHPDPERLVGVAFTFPRDRPNAEQPGASADFVRAHAQAFSSVAVLDDGAIPVNLAWRGERAVQVNALRVSEGYFRTLGAVPALGRGFVAEEDRPHGGKAVVLSHGLWARALGGDPAIVGRAIRLNEETFTVVGVMPADFAAGGGTPPDLWEPLQLSPGDAGYDGDNYQMIARLRPDVTLAQAEGQLHALEQPFYQQFPEYRRWMTDNGVLHEFRAWPLQQVVVSDVRRSLLTVMGAVVAVLLVACLNLAGLMTARAMRRSREMALRTALGATRARLLRLLACEGLLLAAAGACGALVIARVATGALLHAAPFGVPSFGRAPSAWLLAAVTAVVALTATGICAVLPAWPVLRGLRPRGRDALSHARLSRALLVAQVALAMVLVSTASVLLGTFVALRAVPSGVEPRQLTVFQVALKGDRYASARETAQFVSTVLDELRRTPGVERVAAVNGLPLDRGLNVGGYPQDRPALNQTIQFRAVTPGYFQTMGMRVLAGRDLSDAERAGGDRVIVIGETAARLWWPGESPIGASIRVGRDYTWRIVGVVSDAHARSLVETQRIMAYAPMAQLSDEFMKMMNGWFPTTFAVRTGARVGLASAVRHAVERADPEVAVARLTPMQAVIDDTIEAPRFYSLLASGFSGFALALTVIGLFGLLSYQVATRTREIGVRMALGSTRRTVVLDVLRRGTAVASAGVVLGCAASWEMRPVVWQLLAESGVNASGGAAHVVMGSVPATLLAAVTILGATLAASWLPARRAASIDPMSALRAE